MSDHSATGILVISHGSTRREACDEFAAMVGRIAARLEGVVVLPAFLSIGQPDVPTQVAAMFARGVRRLVLMPYFLYSGTHVAVDIPALVVEFRRQYPHLTIDTLSTLQNDPAMEDLLVARLRPHAG
jgi:sirohydrochlorin cobaltochelatase